MGYVEKRNHLPRTLRELDPQTSPRVAPVHVAWCSASVERRRGRRGKATGSGPVRHIARVYPITSNSWWKIVRKAFSNHHHPMLYGTGVYPTYKATRCPSFVKACYAAMHVAVFSFCLRIPTQLCQIVCDEGGTVQGSFGIQTVLISRELQVERLLIFLRLLHVQMNIYTKYLDLQIPSRVSNSLSSGLGLPAS